MNNNQELTPNLPLWSFQIQSDSKLALTSRKDLEIHLITRALKDENFKQELVANPKEVIEQELGTKLPKQLEIKVLEETEDTLYMVLPCNPYEGISEEELKNLVGMTYEDVAQWVLEQQKGTFLDDSQSTKILSRAWKDQTFKQEFMNNSKTVIEQELGAANILQDIEFQVLEETINNIYLVVPKSGDALFSEDIVNAEDVLEDFFKGGVLIIGATGTTTCCATGTC